MRVKSLLSVLFCVGFLAGCAGSSSSKSSSLGLNVPADPTPTPVPVVTPTPTTTVTPRPGQPTLEPTSEPTPTPIPTPIPTPPPMVGWTDITQYLKVSDGSHSLGDPSASFNTTRDQGSKIAYFNVSSGDNATAEVYWWDGEKIVDSAGRSSNPDNGESYGDHPLYPNEAAIKAFATFTDGGDDRLVTQRGGSIRWTVAGGYPDWFLFRRGQTHTEFGLHFGGGKSADLPMVAAAYGPPADGRAVMNPSDTNPFSSLQGSNEKAWFHHVLVGFEIHAPYGWNGVNTIDSYAGGPVTALLEDCYWPILDRGVISKPPTYTVFHRSIISNSWSDSAHSQGYHTQGFKNVVTYDEVIFYKNGYNSNPVINADPIRDIYSRNIYQGGGARMGHTYRNIISMDGASGGPQMRLGGTMENSLIVEGYFYSSTQSNSKENEWIMAEGQDTQSAVVKNNVQLILANNTPQDPDDPESDDRAQPGAGYALKGASFGAVVEGNIISGAMLADDLGGEASMGLELDFNTVPYSNGIQYNQKNNAIRDNIFYRVAKGLGLNNDAEGVEDVLLENNVFVCGKPVRDAAQNLTSTDQMLLDNNRFYCTENFDSDAGEWLADTNVLDRDSDAKEVEGWSDPDRTLKRYVEEELGLTLLDWSDDPYLDAAQVAERQTAGELYDPAGMKTFMAVATRMRYGGTDSIPTSGKPSWEGDYPWDERFTGKAVVNWIREGFGMEPVE